ncbi:MAG: P1 family peptidase [Acidobacteriaceae bacterium]|nr:P1 family peptidase [Acidobacteriaceae bacterium]MBV9780318.1 P1 family peptidase [Acidobacteriaceae bacterium]
MKLVISFLVASCVLAQRPPRARDLHVPFDGTPGPLNAITDVAGVEVGHTTLISGEGALHVGSGPIRTGVTAVIPRGKKDLLPVFAGFFAQNGNGEMTGTIWVEESGFAEGPILLTNTHSVGIVRDASIKWQVRQKGKNFDPESMWSLPIVAETWDGYLNDINGFHVKDQHVFEALDSARGGSVQEGAVGGGTGMICYGFKGGIGTSSRKLDSKAGGYTVGALVQCNCGQRAFLTIVGVPVGKQIPQDDPWARNPSSTRQDLGSIIILVATDAPLLPHQLKRLARRATMGLARTGSISGNGSGDLFLAFSTAARVTNTQGVNDVRMLANDSMDPLFQATIQATEEAIVNAMVSAGTMTGVDGHRVIGLPHDQLFRILKKYNRLAQ